MDTRLLLPPAKAATVQFPPSCPVVFFRSLVTCDDTGKSSSANTQHHGTAVGLGIVRSVFIDLSPQSGRQLIYDVEVLTKRNKKDMPGSSSPVNTSCAPATPGTTDVPVPANDTVEKFELPEWSLRYAPNCPALFDLSCFNEDDDLPAEQSSAIIPNVVGTTPSAAKGIILCGLPTPCEDGDGIAFVYSALIHHDEESQYYEVHDIPLHYIRFDPTSMNQQGHKKDYIDAGTDQDMERKKLTTHDTSNDFNAETKSAEDSSSPKSTSNRNSKSSRRDRDGDPSPSKKSRSSRDGSRSKESRGDRKGDRKDQRKKDRRDRSSSPHKSSRRRDRRSRSGSTSLSRDRVSRSSRSRKHSYSSRSSRSNRSR